MARLSRTARRNSAQSNNRGTAPRSAPWLAMLVCVVIVAIGTLSSFDEQGFSTGMDIRMFDAVHKPPQERIFSLSQRAGDWKIWRTNDETSQTADQRIPAIECEWSSFVPFGNKHAAASQMCLYPEKSDIFVGGSIRRDKRWGDCDRLVGLWNYSPIVKLHARGMLKEGVVPVYLDVGANIGACVMEMLHSTNATIVAFEPHPENLARLTNTIKAQPPELQERVTVVPVGIGKEAGKSQINMAANNRGNSVVGAKVEDREFKGQEFVAPVDIPIETIDDILDSTRVVVPLMKMDVQGFECNVLDGMTTMAQNVYSVATESDDRYLSKQGCTAAALRNRLESAGFKIQGKGLDIVASRL